MRGTATGPSIIGAISTHEARLVEFLHNHYISVSMVIDGEVLVLSQWYTSDPCEEGCEWEWIPLTLTSVREWLGY